MRRRKARQLDQEIAAAAAEANWQAGHAPTFEDEDYNGGGAGGYGGGYGAGGAGGGGAGAGAASYYSTSQGTHGAYGQDPLSPGSGGGGGPWDPYSNPSSTAYEHQEYPGGGAGLATGAAAAAGGPGAYAMRNRRTSTGTGTSAGMAGFGARGAGGGDPSVPVGGYFTGPRSTGHETQYDSRYPPQQGGVPHPGDYYDAYGQPVAAAGAGVGDHKGQYDDAYGGEEEYVDDEHDFPPASSAPPTHQPPFMQDVHRQDSSGTYRDEEHEMEPARTLKVRHYFSLLFQFLFRFEALDYTWIRVR